MIWKIDQSQSEFRFNGWEGGFNLSHPEQGLHVTAPHGSKLENLLGVTFPNPRQPFFQDCYTRLGDLVAAYPQRDARKFNVQLDFRLLDATPESLLVELWVSVQTYLLDSHPSVSVRCALDSTTVTNYLADEMDELTVEKSGSQTVSDNTRHIASPHRAVISGQSSEKNLYVAWFNHPRDQFDTTWSKQSDEHNEDAQLFGHFMEKGVIRRGRMQCWIHRKPIGLSSLQEQYRSFAGSPLPLTT